MHTPIDLKLDIHTPAGKISSKNIKNIRSKDLELYLMKIVLGSSINL